MNATPAALWDAYWVEGKSLTECAKLAGVSVSSLYANFKKWKFPTRPRGGRHGVRPGGRPPPRPPRGLSDEQIAWILQNQGVMCLRLMSEKLGVSKQRIHQIQQGQHRRIAR